MIVMPSDSRNMSWISDRGGNVAISGSVTNTKVDVCKFVDRVERSVDRDFSPPSLIGLAILVDACEELIVCRKEFMKAAVPGCTYASS